MTALLFIYFIIINIVGFVIMYIDKQKAKKHLWRISEATLFLIAAIGGSIGVLLGMQKFRHKTNHIKFTWGIPAIIFIQATILLQILL